MFCQCGRPHRQHISYYYTVFVVCFLGVTTLLVVFYTASQRALAFSLKVFRSHTTTHHSRQDSYGRVINPSQRPLPDNIQHSQQQTSMPSVRFEPTISAAKRPQTYALDRAATGTGTVIPYCNKNKQQNVCNKIKKTYLPRLNATYFIIRERNVENKKKQQANKLVAVRMDFWRRFTEKANSLNNTFKQLWMQERLYLKQPNKTRCAVVDVQRKYKEIRCHEESDNGNQKEHIRREEPKKDEWLDGWGKTA